MPKVTKGSLCEEHGLKRPELLKILESIDHPTLGGLDKSRLDEITAAIQAYKSGGRELKIRGVTKTSLCNEHGLDYDELNYVLESIGHPPRRPLDQDRIAEITEAIKIYKTEGRKSEKYASLIKHHEENETHAEILAKLVRLEELRREILRRREKLRDELRAGRNGTRVRNGMGPLNEEYLPLARELTIKIERLKRKEPGSKEAREIIERIRRAVNIDN